MSKLGQNSTDASFFYPISDKVIYSFDMPFPFATWSYTILFLFDGALGILVDKIFMDLISLIFWEVTEYRISYRTRFLYD